jgi:hypothetical protein
LKRFEETRRSIDELLTEGKISEQQYGILNDKILEYEGGITRHENKNTHIHFNQRQLKGKFQDCKIHIRRPDLCMLNNGLLIVGRILHSAKSTIRAINEITQHQICYQILINYIGGPIFVLWHILNHIIECLRTFFLTIRHTTRGFSLLFYTYRVKYEKVVYLNLPGLPKSL